MLWSICSLATNYSTGKRNSSTEREVQRSKRIMAQYLEAHISYLGKLQSKQFEVFLIRKNRTCHGSSLFNFQGIKLKSTEAKWQPYPKSLLRFYFFFFFFLGLYCTVSRFPQVIQGWNVASSSGQVGHTRLVSLEPIYSTVIFGFVDAVRGHLPHQM